MATRLARARDRVAGISLIEMMAVIVVIGVLAVVAVPAFGRYIRRARSGEAPEALARIAAGANSYFEARHTDVDSRPLARQFPASVGPTPTADCCAGTAGRCDSSPASWNADASWSALRFSLGEQQHYYQYQFVAAGTDAAATFTALAIGNLDCDGTTAVWRVTANVEAATQRPVAVKPHVVSGPDDEIE